MSLLDKKDEEIFKIAEPIWDNLVKSSNMKNYGGFTKDFSSQMLYGANEVELGKQWANNKLLTNLSEKKEVFGCLRRNNFVTVLFKQKSNTVPGDFLGCLRRNNFVTVLFKQKSDKISGEFLGRLVLGIEDDKIKVFGATIF